MGPQRGWSQLVLLENVARGPQRGVAVQHPIGNALKCLSLFEVDAQIAQLHLSLGPRQGLRALECRHVAVLVDQRERLLPAGR